MIQEKQIAQLREAVSTYNKIREGDKTTIENFENKIIDSSNLDLNLDKQNSGSST